MARWTPGVGQRHSTFTATAPAQRRRHAHNSAAAAAAATTGTAAGGGCHSTALFDAARAPVSPPPAPPPAVGTPPALGAAPAGGDGGGGGVLDAMLETGTAATVWFQDGLVWAHALSGLPWWGTIMLTTIGLRLVPWLRHHVHPLYPPLK